ncbi:MAG: hypothetical protein HQL05_10425 [Nitrospirae bacterium]|nr:hypothetical protein [Nitrospirota bacterium]
MKVAKGLELSRNIRTLEMLSRLRDMQKIVIEEAGKMSLAYDLPIEKDLRFIQGKEEGLESGREEGMQDTIELLLRARFGEEGLSFMSKIQRLWRYVKAPLNNRGVDKGPGHQRD